MLRRRPGEEVEATEHRVWGYRGPRLRVWGYRRGGGRGQRRTATVRPVEGEAAREHRRPRRVGPPVGGGRWRG
jgi:hypothetical protein